MEDGITPQGLWFHYHLKTKKACRELFVQFLFGVITNGLNTDTSGY